MAKKTNKKKEVPPSLQNGAVDMSLKEAIQIVTSWLGDADPLDYTHTEGEPDMATKNKIAIAKLLLVCKGNKIKHTAGEQLKAVPMNTYDDLVEMFKQTQGLSQKFYRSRTIKSGRALRKFYLEIYKICQKERKTVIRVMGKKRNKE
jgi:hypothetical protein